MATVIENEMLGYFTQLDEAEKKTVVQLLKTFVKNRKEKGEPITLEQYNQELSEAEDEFARGDYATHEQLLRNMSKWGVICLV